MGFIFNYPYLLIGMTFNSADAQNSPRRPKPELTNNVRRLRLIPLMPPSEVVEYTMIPAGEKIAGRLGLPAAKLINVPPELNEVAVWTPSKTQSPPLKQDDVAYELISSVRYRGADKELVIATYRLSPEAAKLERFLGRAETLADGTTAGVEIANKGKYPNRVVFERGKFIIAVGGNLPIEQIKQIAATAKLQ